MANAEIDAPPRAYSDDAEFYIEGFQQLSNVLGVEPHEAVRMIRAGHFPLPILIGGKCAWLATELGAWALGYWEQSVDAFPPALERLRQRKAAETGREE